MAEIYGVEAYRDLARQVSGAIREAVGREPVESGEVRGAFLLVMPGLKAEAARALGWHVDASVPREIGYDGLLMPVEIQVMVETHDGVTRTLERLGAGRPEVRAA